MNQRPKFLLGLIAFTIVLRVIPYVLTTYQINLDPSTMLYPWNFSPLMAVGLFSGAYIADRRARFALPLFALLFSDLGIWAVTGQFSWAFPNDRWSAYLCMFVPVLLGQGLNRQTWPLRGVSAFGRGLIAESLFFVVTNFAYFCTQTEHPHSMAGLAACYVAAIPFAGRSFVSTAFYSVLLFSPLTARSTAEVTSREPSLQTLRSL